MFFAGGVECVIWKDPEKKAGETLKKKKNREGDCAKVATAVGGPLRLRGRATQRAATRAISTAISGNVAPTTARALGLFLYCCFDSCRFDNAAAARPAERRHLVACVC